MSQVKQALLDALQQCKIPRAGCGRTEYDIDGERLYYAVRGIAMCMPDDHKDEEPDYDVEAPPLEMVTESFGPYEPFSFSGSVERMYKAARRMLCKKEK